MKMLNLIGCIAASLTIICSTSAQDSVAVEGKVIETTSKNPIGAFTVKAYPTETSATPSESVSPAIKALAQTLTRADGSYSLNISTASQTVILQFEKLSFFSVPPQQIVTLTSPKTTVPDVAAFKYSYGRTVSTHDVLDAFKIREESFNAMTIDLAPGERENARKKSIQFDILSLQKAGVDPGTITAVKTKYLPPQ
jgi:hypothetical protein